MNNMKKCKQCGDEKPYSDFRRKSDMKDGRQSSCRECANAYMRKWRRKTGITDREGYQFIGGHYKVIYCPWDSFTQGSSYTKTQIREMLRDGYLSIGTKFRNDERTWEVSSRMKLTEVQRE